MPANRALKPIFQGMVFARVGSYEEDWNDTKVEKWITLRNGRFSRDFDDTVTHLICSRDAFKLKKRETGQKARRGIRVMAALDRYGKKDGKLVLKEGQVHCYILTQDWLYECTKEKRAVNVKPFLLSTIEGEELKEKRIANQLAAKPKKTRVYTDSTYFQYRVILTRRDESDDEPKTERYILTLKESVARPHLYKFKAHFSAEYRDPAPKKYRFRATQQPFAPVFAEFQRVFELKTGVPWDRRLDPTFVPTRESPFRYEPPRRGKPLGFVDGKPAVIPDDPPTPLLAHAAFQMPLTPPNSEPGQDDAQKQLQEIAGPQTPERGTLDGAGKENTPGTPQSQPMDLD